MTTANTILLQMARNVRGLLEGTATAGSTTTLTDTARTEDDDQFNQGTIFFLSGNNAGKSAVITDWDYTTNKRFTFPTQAAACAASDLYAVMDCRFTRAAMIQAINSALLALGPFDQTDEHLSTTDDTETYTLPVGVTNVKRVQFATSTTAPYHWSAPYHHWTELNGNLIFSTNRLPASGMTIRLTYEAAHAEITADGDSITSVIHPDRLAWLATEKLLANKLTRPEAADNLLKELYGLAQQNVLQFQHSHPIQRLPKDRRYADLPW